MRQLLAHRVILPLSWRTSLAGWNAITLTDAIPDGISERKPDACTTKKRFGFYEWRIRGWGRARNRFRKEPNVGKMKHIFASLNERAYADITTCCDVSRAKPSAKKETATLARARNLAAHGTNAPRIVARPSLVIIRRTEYISRVKPALGCFRTAFGRRKRFSAPSEMSSCEAPHGWRKLRRRTPNSFFRTPRVIFNVRGDWLPGQTGQRQRPR